MRNYKANWNNCGTMQRKFTKAWSQEGFTMGLTELKEDSEYLRAILVKGFVWFLMSKSSH